MTKNINQPVAYPIFTFRWLAIHGLAVPTVFFLGGITAMQLRARHRPKALKGDAGSKTPAPPPLLTPNAGLQRAALPSFVQCRAACSSRVWPRPLRHWLPYRHGRHRAAARR